jgi:hypothetical protein
MEKNEKDIRWNNNRNDYRSYEEDNNSIRNSKSNYFYDNSNKGNTNVQKTSLESSSKNNMNLNYNYFTDFSSPIVNNNDNREIKGKIIK